MTILYSFTHPDVVLKLYDFLSSVEHKRRYFDISPCPQKHTLLSCNMCYCSHPLISPQQPLVFVLLILTHFTSSCSSANCDTDRLTCNRGFIWFIPMSSDQITSKNCSPTMSPQLSCSPQLGFFLPRGSRVAESAAQPSAITVRPHTISSEPVGLHDGTQNEH